MSRLEDDPEIRRKLLEIGQAGDLAAFEATGNSLYALWTIGRYRTDEELPLWVRRWLLVFAGKVLRAALDRELTPAEAMEEIARALELTTQGRNKVENLRQDFEDDTLAWARFVAKEPAKKLAGDVDPPKNDEEYDEDLDEYGHDADWHGVNVSQIYRRTGRARKRWVRIKR